MLRLKPVDRFVLLTFGRRRLNFFTLPRFDPPSFRISSLSFQILGFGLGRWFSDDGNDDFHEIFELRKRMSYDVRWTHGVLFWTREHFGMLLG